ncbi:MAG: DUF1572 domain-containing protein [Ferruginibacter sp.]
MNLPAQIAKHFNEVYFGGNWTWSNLKDNLSDITWQQATTKVYDFNTIAALLYHIDYFVTAVLKPLQGQPLDSSDKYSFDVPEINSQEDWERLLNKTWEDAQKFASLVEKLPEAKLWEDFWEGKHGHYYRNQQGIIEHTHYHLGQIALIKKIIFQQEKR